MKAIKGNKVYDITEAEKKRYLADGFDIKNDDGAVIAYGQGKTVSYEEYMKLKNEVERLKAGGTEKAGLDAMSAEELKAYAEANSIDIGQSTSQSGILKKIKDAVSQQTGS